MMLRSLLLVSLSAFGTKAGLIPDKLSFDLKVIDGVEIHYSYDLKSKLFGSKELPRAIEEDAKLTTLELIRKYGYPAKSYYLKTEDGYILNLHRIPHGKYRPATKGSVLIQHGILAASTDFIMSGPEKALGYILADAGYDVWLGNARGNTYSRNHTVLDPKYSDFWQFSWHEIGIYDIPAMIDFILEETGERQIYHIGHSQGTTTFYVMCSLRPEYNEKIKAHFSLAPIAYVEHIKSPLLKSISAGETPLKYALGTFGVDEILPNDGVLSKAGQEFCKLSNWSKVACTNIMFSLCGYNEKQLNITLLPVILAHVPAGSSTRQLLHYAQEINSGHFRRFDHGYLSNYRRYGSFSPPDYPLKKITTPIYLISSLNDWLSSPRDVRRLRRNLNNVKGNYLVRDKLFNHLDFLYGIDAPKLLYHRLIRLMDKHV